MKPSTMKTSAKLDRFTLGMAAICVFGFGGFSAWAGFVPLEEGVAAGGTIVVENDRQVIQHLEGGIIQTIAVQDGSRVEVGETLVVLQETASLASRDQVSQQIAALRASVQRLSALQDRSGAAVFEGLDDLEISDAKRAEIIAREQDLYIQQRDTLAADVKVLETRRANALVSADLKDEEIEIARRALTATEEELGVISDMFAQQLVRRDEVTALERSIASQQGDIARFENEKVLAQAEARDLSVQIAQREAKFSEDVSTELREAYAELLAAEERLFAAQDVLNRSVIAAPVAGEILNLAFSTEGGVVRPGEPILEIVPDLGSITASVRIRPVDRASVFESQDVRLQISAYKSWLTPNLIGTIIDVSADLKTEPATGASYYEARVQISPEEISNHPELEIIPGMPVDVFIFSGKSRTLVDYLVEPIRASLVKGLQSS